MPFESHQPSASNANALTDPFGRRITYLRLSVTDRCDLRCVYCMPERMTFLPRKDVLTFEELERLCRAFMRRGVRKVRLTGGEPLVRKDVMTFIESLGESLKSGPLDELTVTTNGVHLEQFSNTLVQAGVKRVNVSLDTLKPDVFQRLTRRNKLDAVLDGIAAAQKTGLAVKLNTVVMKHENACEIPEMIEWAHARNMDISLIEVMPMGDIDEDRIDQYLPLTEIREQLDQKWTLTPDDYRTGGPSRYFKIRETGGRVGFISPLTNNFCDGCNRVRLTCTGKLYMCLGQNDAYDFRSLMRSGADDTMLDRAIADAIAHKPFSHDFDIKTRGAAPAVARPMSVTGG